MDYRILEFLSYSLDLVIFLEGAKEPARVLIRKDQKRMIRRHTEALAHQLVLTMAVEGPHNGLVNWWRLLKFLKARKWAKALELLPVIGLWPAGPFIDDCPALERFDGREVQRDGLIQE